MEFFLTKVGKRSPMNALNPSPTLILVRVYSEAL